MENFENSVLYPTDFSKRYLTLKKFQNLIGNNHLRPHLTGIMEGSICT